jgi:hypothetical protein
MKRPPRPVVFALLAALSPLALDGCVSVGVDRSKLPETPAGDETAAGASGKKATGAVEVLIFEKPGDVDTFRLVSYPVLSEIYRAEGSSLTLVGRSMSPMWAIPDLAAGSYRILVTKRINENGDIETLKDPRGTAFDLKAGEKATLRVVLKKIPTGWIILGVVAAAALIYLGSKELSKGHLPPLPPVPPDVAVGMVMWAIDQRPKGPGPSAADVFPANGSIVAARRVTVNFLVDVPLAPGGFDADAVLALGTLSGTIPGAVSYRAEDQLVRFTPERDFAPGESVTVTLDLEKVRGPGGRSGEGKISTTFRVAR